MSSLKIILKIDSRRKIPQKRPVSRLLNLIYSFICNSLFEEDFVICELFHHLSPLSKFLKPSARHYEENCDQSYEWWESFQIHSKRQTHYLNRFAIDEEGEYDIIGESGIEEIRTWHMICSHIRFLHLFPDLSYFRLRRTYSCKIFSSWRICHTSSTYKISRRSVTSNFNTRCWDSNWFVSTDFRTNFRTNLYSHSNTDGRFTRSSECISSRKPSRKSFWVKRWHWCGRGHFLRIRKF